MIPTRDTIYLRARAYSTIPGKYSPQLFDLLAPLLFHNFRFNDPSTRGYTRNEDVYPNPEVFDPDRFVNPSNPEVLRHVDSVWGFGRRVCPGKAFAEANLWLAVANTIAVMDVRKALDKDGNPITPVAEFDPGTIRYGRH